MIRGLVSSGSGNRHIIAIMSWDCGKAWHEHSSEAEVLDRADIGFARLHPLALEQKYLYTMGQFPLRAVKNQGAAYP